MAQVDSQGSQQALDTVLDAIGLREGDYPGKLTSAGPTRCSPPGTSSAS